MRPDELLKTLEQAGFEACFVGGCVRDTLLDFCRVYMDAVTEDGLFA